MVAWKVAYSLDTLLDQLNEHAPKRSKASDGSIGDPAHAKRKSDHNPHVVLDDQHWVTARDFTHDPEHGLSCQQLADALRASRDDRIKYAIWNHEIMSGAHSSRAWTWRTYTGPDAHTRHLHLSVVADERCLDDSPWTLPNLMPALDDGRRYLRCGDFGDDVEELQRILDAWYGGIWVDGVFGEQTEAAVKRVQRCVPPPPLLVPDGIVGPLTRAKLGMR